MRHYIYILILIFSAYLYIVMPRMKRRPVRRFIGKRFAHRGLYGPGMPENTLPAFERAAEKRVGIELDVCLTKDGIAVVFHDDALLRACGDERKISALTLSELRGFGLFGTDQRIPTLCDVLKFINGRVPLLIELKPGSRPFSFKICRETARLLDEYCGEFCVESFNPLYLAWFRYHRPQVARGQLLCRIPYRDKKRYAPVVFLLRAMLLNVFSRPDFVSYQYGDRRLLSVLICRMLFRIPLFAWTVTSGENDERRLKRYCSFIFEEPDCES